MRRELAVIKAVVTKKWEGMRYFMQESNAGMGTVEIILIIVVLIGLVIIFKGQITDLVNDIFDKITSQAGKV